MGLYKNVGIHVRFEKHPIYSEAHITLNQLYGGIMEDTSSLYKDDTCNELKDNAHDLLVRLVVDTMIVPFAEDSDSTVVLPLLNKCHLKVSHGNGRPGSRLSGLGALKAVFDRNVLTATTDFIELVISVSPLYFPDSCRFLDWKRFSMTCINAPPLSSPPTLSGLIAALNSLAASGQGNTTVGTTVTSGYTFDPRNLDPDVREAYARFRSGTIITKTHITGPFLNGQRYAEDGQRLILRDGTLFLMDQGRDENGLLRDPPVCKSDTPAATRAWYNSLQRHAIYHGIYVHPLYLFRKNYGGFWGFKAGYGPDDDLPERMQIPLDRMARPLFRLLSKKGMFPLNSPINSILQANHGDGYKVLKQILFSCHPVFQEQPAIMVTKYPQQRELALVEYHSIFLDFLQIRAFIMDFESTLDSSEEMDIFIHNTKHHAFLRRVTRDERTSKAYKYTSEQIIETLEYFLRAEDSPTAVSTPRNVTYPALSTPRNVAPPVRTPRPPARRVNAIGADSFSDTIQELLTLDVPDDLESLRVHSLYARAIYAIQASTNRDAPATCIVCGGTHRFDGCNVLKNTEFLRSHYMRYCQQVRRDATTRVAAFPGTNGEVPVSHARVNAILIDGLVEQSPHFSDSESETAQEFQDARRSAWSDKR